MITQAQRDEIGDVLEIELMKEKVLPSVLPIGLEFKHIPKTMGGADFLIIQNETVQLVIECKNWGSQIPTPDQIKESILERFKSYTENELKVLIGHVNFTKEQQEQYLWKNRIWYGDLGSQVLLEDDDYKKAEFAEKLKSVVASVILAHTGKYKTDCVSPMKLNIIGGNEVVFELDEYKKPLNVKTKKDVWFTHYDNIISYFKKVGLRPLDIVLTIKGGRDLGINVILIPKQYEVYSNNVEFFLHETNDSQQLGVINRENLWINKFFKGVSWKTDSFQKWTAL